MMQLHLGCDNLSDDEFLFAFENCTLSPAAFHHADHVRLAWLYVKRYGCAAAQEKVLSGIRKLADHAGVPGKFLFTTTVAWVQLVAAAHGNPPPDQAFADWIALHPELLDKNLLDRHYSKGLLESPEARTRWIEPDLAPIRI